MKEYLDPLKCAYCSKHVLEFVPPEIPKNPNLIIVGETLGQHERRKKKQLQGESGAVLREILIKEGARPIIVNAVNSWTAEKPTTDDIAECRAAHLIPILAAYPDLPIVSMGALAATAILRGRRSDTSMAGEVLWLYERPVLFTYSPSLYFRSGRNELTLQHITVHIRSALKPIEQPAYNTGLSLSEKSYSFEEIVVDVETSSLDYPWYGSELALIGIMPIGSLPRMLRLKDFTPAVRKYLSTKVRKVAGHNLMYDLTHLAYHGITFDNAELHDTLIYEKNRGLENIGLGEKFLVKDYGFPPYEAKIHTAWAEGKAAGKDIPDEILLPYNAYDLYGVEAMLQRQTEDINRFALDMDYLRYLVQMVQNGIKVDQKKLQAMLSDYLKQKMQVEAKGRQMLHLGKDFNFRSWQQVLPVLRRVAGDRVPNTKESTLVSIIDKHPFVPLLLKQHEVRKASEMLTSINERVSPQDGLIHAKVAEHGAETSRTSSSEPNIQNWPKTIRPMVVSRHKNGKLIYPDLSQLEYRLIAHETQEMQLIKAFRNDEDIHSQLGKMVTGKQPKDADERKIWKTANYVKIYGGGLAKFQYTTELPAEKAKSIFYGKLQHAYPTIDEYKADLVDRIASGGQVRVVNIFGRYRFFNLRDFKDEHAVLREAFNWIFQSSGHDVLKVWLMECLDLIDDSEVLLTNDVHDEFVLDVPAKKVKTAVDAIKFVSANLNGLMESTFGVKLRVPLTAEIELDKQWS